MPGFSGRVLAVFSTTIYLMGDDGEMVWVALEGSPAHRRCLLASFERNSLVPGQGFFTQNTCLRIGLDVAIETGRAREWEPWTIEPDQAEPLPTVNACLKRFFDAIPAPGEGTGFGRAIPLIIAVATGKGITHFLPDSLMALASGPILDIARAFLSQDMARAAGKVRDLVGLGPGLTPSGDDFLGSLLFTVHSLKTAYPGCFCWEQAIITDLIDWATTQTNPISHAILSDLALGHGPEPLHELVNSLLTGRDLEHLNETVARLVGIGHTSGWDLLAGMLTGMLLVKGRMALSL